MDTIIPVKSSLSIHDAPFEGRTLKIIKYNKNLNWILRNLNPGLAHNGLDLHLWLKYIAEPPGSVIYIKAAKKRS